MTDAYSTGTLAGAGSFRCDDCGYTVTLTALDELPECPSCGAATFSRASLFERGLDLADDDWLDTIESPVVADLPHPPQWLDDLRSRIASPGHYLAFSEDDRVTLLPLRKEWTRIGRSEAADIRLDDPTVSRRHALVVCHDNGARVLDDRSLNGILVNGAKRDWASLRDGDLLDIGRFRLYYISASERTVTTASAGLAHSTR